MLKIVFSHCCYLALRSRSRSKVRVKVKDQGQGQILWGAAAGVRCSALQSATKGNQDWLTSRLICLITEGWVTDPVESYEG